MTFGGDNLIIDINMNGLPTPWVSKVKYLGVCFLCNSGKTDLTDTIKRFYSQFNNIVSVLGKSFHEMNAVHLIKTYCLPTLTYGLENADLTEKKTRTKFVSYGTVVSVTFSAAAGEKV